MAIVGSLNNIAQQVQNKKLLTALEYLKSADIETIFKEVSPEKNKTIEIDGKNIFAIYQTYISKIHDKIKVEGHKKYIDIQYIFKGCEQILLASTADIIENDTYNSEKDFYFPKIKNYSIIQLKSGDGAILYPEDLHGPGYCILQPDAVKKIVIKVAVD